jgi:hypothetical protein
MKIISRYRDFYDPIMRTGMDEKIVYNRAEGAGGEIILPGEGSGALRWVEVGTYKCPPHTDALGIEHTRIAIRTKLTPISFCGRYYPIWEAVAMPPSRYVGWYGREDNLDSRYFVLRRALSSVDAMDRVFDQMHVDMSEREQRRRKYRWYRSARKPTFETLPDALLKVKWEEYHLKARAPVLRVGYNDGTSALVEGNKDSRRYVITTNPRLADLNFQEFLDPYTAFQNLSMFIGGVLGQPDAEMVQLTDKDLINKHGFDPKWGFRKPPETK